MQFHQEPQLQPYQKWCQQHEAATFLPAVVRTASISTIVHNVSLIVSLTLTYSAAGSAFSAAETVLVLARERGLTRL